MKHLFVALALLVLLVPALTVTAQADRCSFDAQYPTGSVFSLQNTPHLWLFDEQGLRWVGDTRALVGRVVRWDRQCTMSLEFLERVRKGDPFLSTGLVKIGEPIYLAKWELEQPAPTLLQVQSLADLNLFGITGDNYQRFVLDQPIWEQQFGFNTETLARGTLASAVAQPAPTTVITPTGPRPPAMGSPTPTGIPPVSSPTPTGTPPRVTASPTATTATLTVAPTPARARPTEALSYPLIIEPPDDREIWCVSWNPSCGRDVWWVTWSEPQESDRVDYAFAPGFWSESRFIEAVWLIWQWPEGRDLISQAAQNQVALITLPERVVPDAFAAYAPELDAVGVNRRFTEASTWMIADVIAHELQHAVDDFNQAFVERTVADCVTREQRAYEVESRFMSWITQRMGGLPSRNEVRDTLSEDDLVLYLNITAIANAPDPAALATRDYRQACSERFGQTRAEELAGPPGYFIVRPSVGELAAAR